jgi:D-alanyl-D-alanine carboxypeptidase
MAFANGKIPLSALKEIQGGHLRADAARAWNDLSAEIMRRGGPALRPRGSISSYRSFDDQQRMRDFWCGQGDCRKAAVPGRSNHGLGLAVDAATPAMQDWLRRIGLRYGWSHAEGASVGEPWHFTYIGGYVPKPDPLAVLTETERSWIAELATARGRRKRELRQRIRIQIAVIRAEALKTGWDRKRRRRRFKILRRFA